MRRAPPGSVGPDPSGSGRTPTFDRRATATRRSSADIYQLRIVKEPSRAATFASTSLTAIDTPLRTQSQSRQIYAPQHRRPAHLPTSTFSWTSHFHKFPPAFFTYLLSLAHLLTTSKGGLAFQPDTGHDRPAIAFEAPPPLPHRVRTRHTRAVFPRSVSSVDRCRAGKPNRLFRRFEQELIPARPGIPFLPSGPFASLRDSFFLIRAVRVIRGQKTTESNHATENQAGRTTEI